MRQARLSELINLQKPANFPSDANSSSALQSKHKRSHYNVTANDNYDSLPGFDSDRGRFWIYPNNLAIRDYQLAIVEESLFKNTLVCLPTGLGKTFIATVVLYNFLHWYPQDIVIFIAPTRPLVAQQMLACKRMTAMNPDEIVELTGHTPPNQRSSLWKSKRAFFLTPQVLVNDLNSSLCPGNKIRCLIFDEAHKATGNHAYVQVVNSLTNAPLNHRQFRILALTATPASNMEGLQSIIQNLLISHLELRSEESKDVTSYMHSRELEICIVPLSEELLSIKNQLQDCLQRSLDSLRETGAIWPNQAIASKASRFTILQSKQQFLAERNHANPAAVLRQFEMANFLLYSLELLEQHGLKSLFQYFASVFAGHKGSDHLRSAVSALQGIDSIWHNLNSKFNVQSQHDFTCGHPKLVKLEQLLLQHFEQRPDTRVMVFTQFRDSVNEIISMLGQHKPFIRAASFVGQSSKCSIQTGSNELENEDSPLHVQALGPNVKTAARGITQKDQLRIMNAFRQGTFNTLVATCIGEEGLDVGEVDLIVCFDATKSPIRLIQRLGRTGRARDGKICILLTEGREERNYKSSVSKSKMINNAMSEKKVIKNLAFYPYNPRMIPLKIDPELKFEALIHEQPTCALQTNQRQLQDALKTHVEVYDGQIKKLDFEADVLVRRPWVASGRVCIGYNREVPRAMASEHGVGSSVTSEHLVSTLQLSYLLRHQLTKAHMHACGIRSVNCSISLSSYLEDKMGIDVPAPTQVEPVAKRKEIETKPECTVSVKGVQMPLLSRGAVGDTLFFKARQDPDLVERAAAYLEQLLADPARISEAEQFVQEYISHFESSFSSSTPVKSNSLAKQRLMSFFKFGDELEHQDSVDLFADSSLFQGVFDSKSKTQEDKEESFFEWPTDEEPSWSPILDTQGQKGSSQNESDSVFPIRGAVMSQRERSPNFNFTRESNQTKKNDGLNESDSMFRTQCSIISQRQCSPNLNFTKESNQTIKNEEALVSPGDQRHSLNKKSNQSKKKKRPICARDYLLTQADCSTDDTSAEFLEGSDNACSFLTDATEHSGILDQSSMHAVYLRSLQSQRPPIQPRKPKKPRLHDPQVGGIFRRVWSRESGEKDKSSGVFLAAPG
ncbi:hypothetical protein Ciccas_010357 [Cichlidogyrus casuarinus]|uniref:Fanconi anemia group M protein n=1 Tax=Cichlidogyrus casuarinus TaxID=1844966 RepID=A0ABD2PWB7_9PLAT